MRKFILATALGLITAAAVLSFVVAGPTQFGDAASHRDAPLITEDPTADNTDVYAFVSREEGRSDYVTLIANYIPLEEPGDGPNYFRFSDDVLYEIMVDVDGDAEEDLTYQFDFGTNIGAVTPNTFLYNTGKIGLPPNPGDPTSQYTNWNQPQSFTLTENFGLRRAGPGVVLLEGARVAPSNVGPNSVGTQAEYEALAEAAMHTIGYSPDEIRIFAGPRDEGFYVDLMGAFDLINIRDPGVDTTSGFNVHTIALEVPKSRFQDAGDTDGNIGVWASASRPKTTVLRRGGQPPFTSDRLQQVSRLGNPLVNEVLIPLSFKDQYNASHPSDDEANITDLIVDPGTSQGSAALIPILNSLTGCTPTDDRADLELALLTGIPAGVIPGFPGNQDTQDPSGPAKADMLRLNYNIPPATSPSPLGLLGGDIAGFPNGRRVGDDVLDIDLKAAAGAVLHVLGAIDCPVSLDLSDNVDGNDVPYLSEFPYLGIPHQGFDHEHAHGSNGSIVALSMGMGVLGLVLGLGLAAPRLLARFRRTSH